MRKIKLFPAPHTELRLDVSDEMEKDYRECRRMAQSRNDGKDCNTCSWRPVEIEDTGVCEWPEVIRQMDRDLVEESGDDGCNQN
ncbi:hypothetical protein [Enterocloster bolteae]|uniref:hypothetical protein n=1 Tax=Enterocloster bolteae TaxID=208479 RepID=UPI0026766455|nr:hypothetical protein [Enterocloster bolteae]